MPVPFSGCWLWTEALNGAGYGVANVSNKVERAHRLSFLAFKGSIPDGMYICHSCDEPSCVNPDHLFAGTPKQNMDDMRAKGRQVLGERRGQRNGSAKITDAQAVEIYKATDSNMVLAAQYGITSTMVGYIRSGKNWAHVTGHLHAA